MTIPLLVICGPTASGKTRLALDLANQFPLEVISADSRQVYRQMDIGTAKATSAEQAVVPHHLIDLIDPDQDFSVAEFVELARPLAARIHAAGKLPCVVGGTGLYIKALLGGLAPLPAGNGKLRQQLHAREADLGPGTLYRELQQVDPEAATRIHPNNLVRIVRALEVFKLSGRPLSAFHAEHRFADQPFCTLQFGMDWERSELFERIDRRSELMVEAGLVDEVAGLVEGYSADLKVLQTLGYQEALNFIFGQLDAAEMVAQIQRNTRLYAKRQLTWFRKQPEIIWVDSSKESGRVLRSIEDLIQR